MSAVVDVTIPTDQFALAETLDAVPAATFETVRVAAHGPRGMMRFLWGSAPDLDRLDEALRADSSVEAVSRLSTDSHRALYRVTWRPGIRLLIGIFVQSNGSLLGATGQSDRWELRVVFPDRASVSETYDNWRNHGIDPTIRRINGVTDTVDNGGMALSPCQHETLVEAFQLDYYEVPRGITLDGLAAELDISHQALSERLRRGHRNLIGTTLCESPTLVRHEP
ncbi:DNA-binding protein [Halobacteriales archaeon QH_6_66_25]|nr:MAG: DNA-binding protein [Halobacteriales archaeon QH_2_66_30]PSP47837.1 MAG: DNA-binding protein [Halobacteriales archaeon QH_6_66_25]